MKQIYGAALVSLLALSGCLDGTNPFMGSDEAADDGGSGGGGGGGNGGGGGDFITGGGTPPGIDGPGATSSSNIVRFEARNDNGGGYAQDFAYDAGSDTFSVTNLAFDGERPYARGVDVASLGPTNSYAVYDAEVQADDFLTGQPVDQIVPYRAIVGISSNSVGGAPRTSFAIVRTGGYVNYGFGGFVYQREGGVVLPTPGQGQATFSGDYAGVRIFDGRGGMEFV